MLCCGYYLLKRKSTIEDSLVEKDPQSPHVNFCCDLIDQCQEIWWKYQSINQLINQPQSINLPTCSCYPNEEKREFKNFMLIMNQNMPFLILIPLKMLLNFKVLLMHLRDPCPNRLRTLKALYSKCLTLFGQTSSWDYINFNSLIIVMNFETCSWHHGSRKNESATFKTIK